jgi:uncharacterized protein YhaN
LARTGPAAAGPRIERANELFPLLTVRSFEGIRTHDEKGQLVLIGRRGRDEAPVEGMSDGIRDQLYLALRIAAKSTRVSRKGRRRSCCQSWRIPQPF